MLEHSETERLGFIQVTTHKGAWGNFMKTTVNAAYAYSIEVFRGQYYVNSIAPTERSDANQVQQQLKSMKVKDGDTLLWVSLTPHRMDMNIPLTTVDGNYPVCKLTVMLRVDKNRSREFANHFNQNNDPIELVKVPIANALQQYVRRRTYNQLDEDDMRYRIQQSLYGENKQYGLIVESVPHLSISPDAQIAQRIQIIQQADTTALQDKVDQERAAQQQDFALRQDAITQEHKRVQQRRDKDYQRSDELMDGYNQVMKEALPKRLQRDLMAGKSIYHIMEEYPDIKDMYALPTREQPTRELPWRDRAQLAAGTPGGPGALARIGADNNIVEGTDEQIPGLSPQQHVVFGLREPGISVLRVQLSAVQRQQAGVQTLTAMLVCQVKADEEEFAVGDLITTVEGIAVTDIQVLVTILKENHPRVLSAKILRGETVLNVSINSME